ncbi:hypothetical protein [Clostridium frigidicarnis]|uniref:Bacteriophage peptidoglycan hydrolase n=1 Tax=Clostridium frigidicarnis TaxID=84698 RepID=A0A1I0WE50_9CLOT|nr:hypothetical protein [Clostridium frigidicarnis]SFA87029.1 hypothetical protein SAMN04488528_100529 [Clostridium frigidicarnis]
MKLKTLNQRHFKKIIIVIISIVLLLTTLYVIKKFSSEHKAPSKLGQKIYTSMNVRENRIKVYNTAVNLNNGDSSNTCVYFISEVLRTNGEKINHEICNTSQILDIMKKNGWKKETDYKKLKPGDICFTTDEKLNKRGIPTHTYVFMGWKDENKYDYAYVCDNQSKDYDNMIYHLRNITKNIEVKGNAKEPFSFFMYK